MAIVKSLADSYGPEATPHENLHPLAPEATDNKPDGLLAPSADLTTNRKRILGFRIRTVSAIAALIVVIALGVGIGAGVGIGRQQRTKDPSSLSTTSGLPSTSSVSTPAPSSSGSPTSTQDVAPVTSGTHGIAANSCKSKDPQTYRTGKGTTFVAYCFTDWPTGHRAFDGDGIVKDIGKATVYDFESCMEECEKFNDENGNETRCWAITYSANLTSSIGGQGGNCFLKDRRGIDILAGGLVASAAMAP